MIKRHKYLPAAPDDIIIWHYMSVDKFMYLLNQSQLYFSRVDKLEDKAEVLVSEIEKKYWRDLFHNEMDPWIEHERKKVFINCWIKADIENSLMWAAYADQGKGVAIRTTVKKLMDSYKGGEHINILDVKYINHKTETVQPGGEVMNALRFFASKRIFYKSEQELRLIFESDIENKFESFQIPVNTNTLIEELHIGPNLEANKVEMIKTEIRKRGGRFTIRESEMLY